MIEAIINGVYEDIHDRFRPNQHVCYHGFEDSGEDIPGIDLSQIYLTVSYKTKIRVDLRYVIIRFALKNAILTTCTRFYTKWHIPDDIFQIHIADPKGFSQLANWLVGEIIDGLKRGRSGRQEKRVNYGYKNFRS